MQDERWAEILDQIVSRFDVIDHQKEPTEQEGICEYIIFNGPTGKIKLSRTTRPAVIDKKVIGAHRRGKSQAQFEYIYSDTEKVSKIEAFKEIDGEWQEVEADNLI